MMSNIILVSLVGLPGAGKSTLCKKIVSDLNSNSSSQLINTIHICYDDIIPLHVQKESALLKQSGVLNLNPEYNWKAARQKIHTDVALFLDYLKTGNQAPSNFNIINPDIGRDDNACYVILLDDNFYYRSMRYEYFQLARKYGVGYCQLYVECSTEAAIQQNSQRDAQVPVEVVKTMAAKLQPPQPCHHSWESLTCVFQADSMENLSSVREMFDKCFRSPVPPMLDHSAETAASRLQCSRSVAHQADLHLRAIVGHLIKEIRSKETFDSKKMAALSYHINDGRQKVLGAMQDGRLHLPIHMAENINDENREEFKDFLKYELVKNIANMSF